jgi:hypothetical protein
MLQQASGFQGGELSDTSLAAVGEMKNPSTPKDEMPQGETSLSMVRGLLFWFHSRPLSNGSNIM